MVRLGGEDRRIQVYTDCNRIGSTADFIGRMPTIKVSLNGVHDKIYRALIDTGAENSALDSRVAQSLGVKEIQKGYGKLMNGESDTSIVPLCVFINEANITFDCYPHLIDTDEQRDCFSVILGRSFLRHCRFVVDGANEKYFLEWVGNNNTCSK